MTDNEIIRALQCCRTSLIYDCKRCNLRLENGARQPFCTTTLIGNAFDLINRLQAKAIKEQNKNSKLRNERNRLQAQNKDLAETVHNLTIEKDALFDKAEELKAEIERLKTNLNVELENFATEYDNKIKAEAIKEFAEKLRADWLFGGKDGKPYRETINNLVKEMVGEDK